MGSAVPYPGHSATPHGAGSDLALTGRVALVSGGDRGVGPQLVRRLAELGMRVVLGSRSAEHGRRALDTLGDLADRVAVRQLDVLDPDSVRRVAAWLRERLGGCDVLVNDATHRLPGDRGAARADLDVVRRTLDANLLGPWRLTQAVAPMMRAQGYGRVVTVCADHDHWRHDGQAAYRVSHSAVQTLTTELSAELEGLGILVNACCVRPPRESLASTRTPVWLATLPAGGPTGQLFCSPAPAG
ncbi:short-chain dehydrogenase [Asanoa ishikariensis]|uniref:Short-chain dehydrogenase n=1 Tax=Asanoa ishikariensis TaxID=137265 RepID=A0A1H3TBY1_9ACTN|nr:SDR family NAD(P)-dependent oxidoreductase [Asanoa ishikariensis]GIF62827.1 short-chain dehydrogenase [Asanoa ishikariensis]SDZ46839.1 Short-chain dehydrogenase [Asanoa ishikariensis]